MSSSSINGSSASGTFDAAADTLEFTPSSDCVGINISMTSAASLVGFNFLCEVQFIPSGAWYTLAMNASNDVLQNSRVAASGVLAAVPAQFWTAVGGAVAKYRIRASALTSGSCIMRITPLN